MRLSADKRIARALQDGIENSKYKELSSILAYTSGWVKREYPAVSDVLMNLLRNTSREMRNE